MIDYILCKRRFKKTLVDARAYNGTKTTSDHKVVCAKFQFSDRHLTFIKRSKSDPKYEVSGLTSRTEIQAAYIEELGSV